jgi:hypothetical protein
MEGLKPFLPHPNECEEKNNFPHQRGWGKKSSRSGAYEGGWVWETKQTLKMVGEKKKFMP